MAVIWLSFEQCKNGQGDIGLRDYDLNVSQARMMKNLNENDIEHLNAAVQVIGINIDAFYAGELHAYRPIASELRKLLCDYQKKNDISLLPRCFPGIHFHVLIGSSEMIDDITTLYVPGITRFDGAGSSDITQLFNEQGPMLPLTHWLAQKLFSNDITIKEFIRSVADKQGAHADLQLNNTLLLTGSIQYPQGESLAAKTIVAIARYVINGIAIRSLVFTGQNKSLYNVARTRGRGVMSFALRDFCRHGIGCVEPEFLNPEEAIKSAGIDKSDEQKFEDLLKSYNPDVMFLLMTKDLNGKGRNVYALKK